MTYDEKLAEAKRLYQTANKDQKYLLESLFPELRESEDERIRKALIEYFNEQCDMSDWNGVYGYQVVDWLEKQGKKSQRMISAEAKEALYDKSAWSEEDEKILEDIEEAIINYWHGQSQEDLLDWLKSLKERITWKPSEEQMNALDSTLQYNQVSHNSFEHLNSLFNDLKKLK